jgi:hypothetical protein
MLILINRLKEGGQDPAGCDTYWSRERSSIVQIKVEYDKKTGKTITSFPHPAVTHLIISDHRRLLEEKLAEVVPWGMILINGDDRAAALASLAVQLGSCHWFASNSPAALLIVRLRCLERVDHFITAKRAKQLVNVPELPSRPFPHDIMACFRRQQAQLDHQKQKPFHYSVSYFIKW